MPESQSKLLVRPAMTAEGIRKAARDIAVALQGREPTEEDSAASERVIESMKREGKTHADDSYRF